MEQGSSVYTTRAAPGLSMAGLDLILILIGSAVVAFCWTWISGGFGNEPVPPPGLRPTHDKKGRRIPDYGRAIIGERREK